MNKSITKLLIANRGEIAVRIAHSAAALRIASVMAHSEDDRQSLHVRAGDAAAPLAGTGPAAYLDVNAIVAAAVQTGCDALHPGYGFLSENAQLARSCEQAGIRFVGPSAEALDLLGDKVRTRSFAEELGVPLLPGTQGPTDLEQARLFMKHLGKDAAIMIKAVAGGGGRGIRPVYHIADLEDAYARCRSEALGAFGRSDVYVERLVQRARHVEVQIIGDGRGAVSHLWDRDCSLQRRNQKLVEIAPANLPSLVRQRLFDASLLMARSLRYAGLGTFEFLVDEDGACFFMEANPRLQVEHTVTEAITGLDLVELQLRIAEGESLAQLALEQSQVPKPNGTAVQIRINMERVQPNGQSLPSEGLLTRFDVPMGAGIRVDSFVSSGYRTTSRYDSLLAKLIVHAPRAALSSAIVRARRALDEFGIEGVHTNVSFLRALLARPEIEQGEVHTRFVESCWSELVDQTAASDARGPSSIADDGKGLRALVAPMGGRIVAINVCSGQDVRAGEIVAVLEAMKMEYEIRATCSGRIESVHAALDRTMAEGEAIASILPNDAMTAATAHESEEDLDHIRDDLRTLFERRAALRDDARPEAVAKRRRTEQRTARENLAALFDGGEYTEYGEFAVAGQRDRRSEDELRRLSPADGMITGIGTVNAADFGADIARCIGMAYDYTVFAGTQGLFNHAKKDRMLQLAERWRLPVALFAEGGGGRAGDTDWERTTASALAVPTFHHFASLSALVPLVGIASGRCFAGNAALLGCCDVIIATRNSTIGMGGPAMIEGAGLGRYAPEDVGPVSVQGANGVIDVLVEDEGEAALAARRYLSYFQGQHRQWECEDQRRLRRVLPENRARSYDMRHVIATLADSGSMLELRPQFGRGLITALIRVEGRALGLIANNPLHLGGAIDADAADKGARFLQLCDAHDLPIVSLCDTPGFMVGPEVERAAQVRHVSRLFVTAASITVPFFTIVLRKAYGLGAQAMSGGGFHSSFFTVAWPSGELGPMGPEGAVRLGYRKELEAADPASRKALFDSLLQKTQASSKALNVASYLEIDSVIDPRDSRAWILRGLRSVPAPTPRTMKKRPLIDTW